MFRGQQIRSNFSLIPLMYGKTKSFDSFSVMVFGTGRCLRTRGELMNLLTNFIILYHMFIMIITIFMSNHSNLYHLIHIYCVVNARYPSPCLPGSALVRAHIFNSGQLAQLGGPSTALCDQLRLGGVTSLEQMELILFDLLFRLNFLGIYRVTFVNNLFPL